MNGFVVLLALVAAAVASDVVVLQQKTFDPFLKENPHVLVEFFAPWCGHCKNLAPEYEKAAAVLKAEGVILASVDVTEEKDLASKYNIRSLPTMKFFRKGVPEEYKGGRSEDTIVSYMRKKMGPAAEALTSTEAIEKFKKTEEVTVVGFFAAAEGTEYQNFVAAADEDRQRAYAYTTSAEVATAAGVTQPAALVFKHLDDTTDAYTGSFDKESLLKFVADNSAPLVIPYATKDVDSIFHSKYGKCAFLIHDKDLKEFRALAAKYKGKMAFTRMDTKNERIVGHIGAEKANLPTLVLLDTSGKQMLKYPIQGELTAESMAAHIEAFLKGELKAYFKQSPPPAENPGPVVEVVGSTFKDIVLDETKNVFLEIYTPWCGHCKKLAPVYEELGEFYKNSKDIVIAKMDGDDNEIEGMPVSSFPTLYFFKAGKKTSFDGEEYRMMRELDSFKNFLKRSVRHDEL